MVCYDHRSIDPSFHAYLTKIHTPLKLNMDTQNDGPCIFRYLPASTMNIFFRYPFVRFSGVYYYQVTIPKYHGNPQPSFLGIITHISRDETLHFSWFWCPRVEGSLQGHGQLKHGSQIENDQTLTADALNQGKVLASVTLSPIIMEVESYPKSRETAIGGTHFSLNHDCGRKSRL